MNRFINAAGESVYILQLRHADSYTDRPSADQSRESASYLLRILIISVLLFQFVYIYII